MPPDDRHPVAARVNPISEAVWLRLFFLPVFLIGAGFFAVVTFWPLWQILDARHWQETPCVVESSQVVAHQGDDSTSYSIEVVYHYYRAGQPYTSRRYNLVAGSWSGYRAKQAVVAHYPPGSETVCFVNPKAPQEAVIHRGWHPEMGMGGFGLIFALAGGLGLAFAGRIAASKTRSATVPNGDPDMGHEVAPAANHTPFGRCFAKLIAVLLLNAFLGCIAYFLFFVEDRQNVELGPRIIIGLLLLATFFLLIDAVTKFIAHLNPRAQVPVRARAKPVHRRRG